MKYGKTRSYNKNSTTNRGTNPAPNQRGIGIRLSILEKYLPYYLDCVREDEGLGARYFLNDEGKRFIVPHINQEWCLMDQGVLTIQLSGDAEAFARLLRQRGNTGALYYGYPIYVDWIARSRRGWTGGFVMPVFLMPVEYEQSGAKLDLRLIVDWPRVNYEFLNGVFASIEERRNFLKEVGLLDTEEEPPAAGLSHFGQRLKEMGILPESEPIDPTALGTVPPIMAIKAGGLYNRSMVVLGERSKFTAGLEHELEALRDGTTIGADRTALRYFFGNFQDATEPSTNNAKKPVDIIEVVHLNDEQRTAVHSAFENNFTIVTGPPGTGKSQVVVSVLANAYIRGERVLFTSRNNKAVDVVETRINSFSSHPLIVRGGTRSGDRDLRKELVQFLTQLLSVSTTEEDRRAYQDAIVTLNSIKKRRDNLWDDVERVRKARNFVDSLDCELDGPRERLGAPLFERLFAASYNIFDQDPNVALKIVNYHTSPQRGFLRKLACLFRRRRDAAKVSQQISKFRDHPDLFGDFPPIITGKGDWEPWVSPLEGLIERVDVMERVRKYKKALAALKELPSPEEYAEELADIEERLWEWSGRLISAYGHLLPDRLTSAVRRAIGEFRASLERLMQNHIGGKAYAKIRQEQERLFSSITNILPIWCVTNLAARGTLPFESGIFDLVIIDEASQCDIPSAIPLFFRAKRAMIIGDPQQLRHISRLERHQAQLIESRHNLVSAVDQPYTYVNNSLFDLAVTCAGEFKVITLREHFRSHADIIEFSNRTWYRNTLRVCTDYRQLKGPAKDKPAVYWTEVKGTVHRPGSGGAVCGEEAKAVVDELEDLLVKRKFAGTVGVVTPFRAQANRISDLVTERLDISTIERNDLLVDTANNFQGDERDVIIFSPCIAREMPRGAKYFLSSTGNLFNVAITRARALLHIMGNQSACGICGIPFIESFANYVATLGGEGRPDERKRTTSWTDPRIGHWERPFYEALVKEGLKPMHQYSVNQYRLDIAIVHEGLRLDIEIDGEYYHREWDGSRCREDIIRDWRLAMLGWTVKRFWVYRIRDEMDQCVNEVVGIIDKFRQ
jgi:very-short-patch-repair endonuclease